MSVVTDLTYQAMLWTMRHQARRFARAALRLERTQRELLRDMLAGNASSEFGRAHDFANIRSFEDFRRAVPVRKYDDLGEWIDQIASGAPNVLTCEPVERFVPSSGSAAGTKFIPYTRALRQQFKRAIGPWVYSTYA